MIVPSVLLRMEQRNLRLSDVVRYQHQIGFVTIAHRAGKAKIVERGLAAGGTWDDVLELEDSDRQVLRRAAVGTTIREPFGGWRVARPEVIRRAC
jgi:hypothetical protein